MVGENFIPGKRNTARNGKLGFWTAWSYKESRVLESPYRSLRPTMTSQFWIHLESIGTVASLWRCSWGWCSITTLVMVGIGFLGILRHRHTFTGLWQPLSHILLRGWWSSSGNDDVAAAGSRFMSGVIRLSISKFGGNWVAPINFKFAVCSL